MAYKILVKNIDSFRDLIESKDLKMSQEIVKVILKNLNTTKRFIPVLEIYIEGVERVIDLTIDRRDFLDTLESNIETHILHEEYEACTEIQDAIKKLRKKELKAR